MDNTTGLKSYWGWLFGLGVILIILGIIAIGAPFVATFATVVTLGWLLIIAGLAEVLFSFSLRAGGDFLLRLLIGIFSFLIGILMVTNPTVTAATITLLLAAFFLTVGLFRIFSSLILKFENWGWVLVGGIVSVILGVLILMHWPSSALWILGLFIGIELLFTGWSFVFGGMVLKRVG